MREIPLHLGVTIIAVLDDGEGEDVEEKRKALFQEIRGTECILTVGAYSFNGRIAMS